MVNESEIIHGTQPRFWAQTHYKPTVALSNSNPTDRAMMPVWRDINAKVRREAREGRLVLSHRDPVVAQQLEHAKHATHAAVVHLEAAALAESPRESKRHVDAAAEA